MNTRITTLLAALLLAGISLSVPALAGETVPINATFGIQWTPVDWSGPVRVTKSTGAAGLSNGNVLAIHAQDRLDTQAGHITSDFLVIYFSYTDWVYAQYEQIPAGFDPFTGTASFSGPVEVVGGEGRFAGATGRLTITSRILFGQFFADPAGGPDTGTFRIKGTIKTAH